eukprot:1208894-Karenia_brevis.AAC.1
MAIDVADREDATLHAELLHNVPDDEAEFDAAAEDLESQASTKAERIKKVKNGDAQGDLDAVNFDPWANSDEAKKGWDGWQEQ